MDKSDICKEEDPGSQTLAFFAFFDKVKQHRQEIVHRPIQHQTGRAFIEDDQKKDCKPEYLNFFGNGMAAGIEDSGKDVAQCHQDRKKMKVFDPCNNVRRSQVADP